MIIFVNFLFILWLFIRFSRRKNLSVAFLHPYCDAGGGGEKVLWEAVNALSVKYPHYQIFVYTGDSDSSNEILGRASSRFNLRIPDNVALVKLNMRWLVEAKTWPYFTLAGQAFGSIFLAFESLIKLNPEIVIDTMGYAFTYPLYRLCGAKVACYIHYPFISTDMIGKVRNRDGSFNNNLNIANNAFLTNAKLIYYKITAWLYSLCGKCSSAVMTNSSWTARHINTLWNLETTMIYPPCDVTKFNAIPIQAKRQKGLLISLAQFRPEKNHIEQVHVFKKLKENISDEVQLKFIMAGGVRNAGDEKRATDLEALSDKLGLSNDISVERNITFERMIELFETAQCAIHTMKDEHFGITCVDFKSAGILTVAHNSAGPAQDILIPYNDNVTGFLANDADEFAEILARMFTLSDTERYSIQQNAKKSCYLFTSQNFRTQFVEATTHLFL